MFNGKWQVNRLAPMVTNGGTSLAHTGGANGRRVWNSQPEGLATSEGTFAASEMQALRHTRRSPHDYTSSFLMQLRRAKPYRGRPRMSGALRSL